MAEPAREVDLANFCQYYKPMPGAFDKTGKSSADDAMAKLRALFGDENNGQDATASGANNNSIEDARKRFDDLFRDD